MRINGTNRHHMYWATYDVKAKEKVPTDCRELFMSVEKGKLEECIEEMLDNNLWISEIQYDFNFDTGKEDWFLNGMTEEGIKQRKQKNISIKGE